MKNVDTFEAELEAADKTIDGKPADKAHAKGEKSTGKARVAATIIIALVVAAMVVIVWTTGVFDTFSDKGNSPDDPVIGEWASLMSTAHIDTESVPAPGNTLEGLSFNAAEDGDCTLIMGANEQKCEWSFVDKIDKGTLGIYLEYALKASGTQVGEFYIYMNSEADPRMLYLHFNGTSTDIVFEKQS